MIHYVPVLFMRAIVLIVLFVCLVHSGHAQRNNIWCFGDSAGIDFGSGSAIPLESGMDGRGSCVSIADPGGNLLFYAATMYAYSTSSSLGAFIFNANHEVMENGDSIFGQGWYQEIVIIPHPRNDSTYYLFSIGVTSSSPGLRYSLIDMRLNGGLGKVVIKNIQLQSFAQVDCINAVKHGNGRDWWLLFRKSDAPSSSNNDWYSYLINPDSIQNFQIQSIGEQNRTGGAHTTFNSNGNKLVFSNWVGVLELFDFDRCSGILSNPVTIETDPGSSPYPFTWSSAFSSDGTKLYVSTSDTFSFLFQYDLSAPNISLSKDTLWSSNFPSGVLGALKLAPDNKIYLANQYYNGFQLSYPYPDSVFNIYNMNLSVINDPDNLGASCDFQPFSFQLGGKRSYKGLPNNPEYDLGPLVGSVCDTLVGIEENSYQVRDFFTYYSSVTQTIFLNANNLKGDHYSLTIYDLLGRIIYSDSGLLHSAYFIKNIACILFSNGIYTLSFVTDSEKRVCRFVK